MTVTQLRTRKLTIIAQDPSVKVDGKILRTQVEIPAEELQPGPVEALKSESELQTTESLKGKGNISLVCDIKL